MIRFPYKNQLARPVIGLEAELEVFVDEHKVAPEDVWRTPSGFIDRPLLKRATKSSQLPTGGAIYFDGGVLEVVTPVIELAPQCTARVVRSLWEQIDFVRDALDRWEARSGQRVRLAAYSCHINISFELPRDARNERRTIQKLALLLAHVLPAPVLVAGANRRSSGIGVRPRRDRIEITLDLTPDPGLMAATTALVVGIAREVIAWPSYRLDELDARAIPRIAEFAPGEHETRKGWAARAAHFPRDPFATSINAIVWPVAGGDPMSLRQIALAIATAFRDSIRRYSDAFSERLLFSVLRGETPSLLELRERPAAYDDIGRAIRWGTILPELENLASLNDEPAPRRRREDVEVALSPPWIGETLDRRERVVFPSTAERRAADRRAAPPPKPAPRLTRSVYEKVFLKLACGKRVRIDDELLTPVAVKGWYHSVFRAPNGEERLLSIDDLVDAEWHS